MSKIISIATGVPAHQHQQAQIADFAGTIYGNSETDNRKLRFLYRHSGIQHRYSVMPDYSCAAQDRQFYPNNDMLEPFPNLELRMEWFQREATPLCVNAIKDCIDSIIEPQQITHLITVSCTGMSAPGLDLDIMEALNLHPNTQRNSINFMGCYAAIPAMKQAHQICRLEPEAKVVVICVELCTLHFQKLPTPDNIMSTLLFADGAAALLVTGDQHPARGLSINHFYSEVVFQGKKDMSWQLSSTGFLMTLTGYVPELVKTNFGQLLNRALQKAQIDKEAIAHWCIHPGGSKILEAIAQSAGLGSGSLQSSFEVLENYGNMSSPTVLFVLAAIWKTLKEQDAPPGSPIFGAAFGPGITMETFIVTYD